MEGHEAHDDWFDAATAGNTEYLEENIEELGGSTTDTGCSGLIRAIYAHKLSSIEVLAAREYKIPDISNKYPIEIALKLYYYEACFILLMLHPDKTFESRVNLIKEQYESNSITKEELNKKLAELSSEFVAGIRDGTLDGTLSLPSPSWSVSRVPSVASCEVFLTPDDQSVQSTPMENAEDEAGIMKKEINEREEDSDSEDHKTRERRSLVDNDDDDDDDDSGDNKSDALATKKKGCCQCM